MKFIMIRAAIIGATGYAGSELLRLLYNHPHVKIGSVTSHRYTGMSYSAVFENYRHCDGLMLEEEDIQKLADENDVVFFALPHGETCSRISRDILNMTKVIDLGADFRLKDWRTYEEWYESPHVGKELLDEAVYGLCEINREHIKKARLIANPGCYTTCSILCMYPLVKEGVLEPGSIIIDAKSGVSGAGRSVGLGTHFTETNESVKAYKVASHRHSPEIEEQLSQVVTFTPHLIPINRGILATCYGKLNREYAYDEIAGIYEAYYGDEYFIRLTSKGVLPETKWVETSNFCDIGFTIDERTGRIIVVGALDNLVKGAAGQAVQNMNLLFEFDEKAGIDSLPVFP